jgi:ParB family chromosome partitioning protein
MTVVQLIPVDKVRAGDNDRRSFDTEALQELADDILHKGLIQPITVRPMGDMYEIIAGERRYRATILAGLTEIEALVRHGTDEEASGWMLSENLFRADLNPIEEARAYQKRIDDFGWDVARLAAEARVSPSRIKQRLNLLKLREDVQHLVKSGNLALNYAGAMVGLDFNRQAIALQALLGERKPTI